MADSLERFKETLRSLTMESVAGLRLGDCKQCHKPAWERCYSSIGWLEFAISGICEVCFDAIGSDEE